MDSSLFGRLPAELRNHIYELIIPEQAEMHVNVRRRSVKVYGFHHPPGYVTAFEQKYAHVRALAATCTDVRRECMSLFYATHEWHIFFEPFYANSNSAINYHSTRRPQGFREIHDWLAMIGPDITRCLKGLKLFVRENLQFLQEFLRGNNVPGQDRLQPKVDWLASHFRDLKAVLNDDAHLDIAFEIPLFSTTDFYHTIEHRSKDPTHAACQIDRIVQKAQEERAKHRSEAVNFHKTREERMAELAKWFFEAITG